MSTFSPDQYTLKVFAVPHLEYPDELKHVFVEVIHSTDGEVGRLEALQIKRCCGPAGEACIFEILDDEGPELARFARTLFEVEDEGFGHGHFRSDLINHEYLRGTGVWGQELDRGMLIYVQTVRAYEKRHKGKGLPSLMLQKLAQSEHAPAGSFLVARPVPEESLNDERRAAFVNLYHKNGYRRIGRTSYMAYSKNPLHASRSLPAANDVEEQRDRNGPIVLGMPLHEIIRGGPLDESVPDVDRAIRLAYTKDPTSVKAKNESGLSPLRMAVNCENVSAVRSLLALPATSGIRAELDLHERPHGLNPEEACQTGMLTARRAMESITGNWPGWTFADGALHILYLLKHARGQLAGVSEDAFVHTLRWGCTCGQCADGWLSPRMRYRLMETAQRRADAMKRTIRACKRGPVPNGAPGIDSIPADIRAVGINKAFYEGYEVFVRAIATVLEQPGDAGLPLPGLVHAAVGDRANQFLLMRGRVEHALDFVAYAARSESPYPRGNGAWDQRQTQLVVRGDKQAAAFARMVTCENDLDFSRVAERAGLPDAIKYHAHGDFHRPGGAVPWLPFLAAGMGMG
ncbi:hypothetical protein LXA43DRAFT_1107377 [Ganoderma leucocontextum]|nr:hypothetical protein LXA43DRAFT_1107377 [Ganoderma leucocontextum]